MGKPSLSIVIVNFKKYSFLYKSIDSVKNSQLENYEIIVVDQEYNEEQNREMESRYPGLIIINNKVNHGFAIPNNQGIAAAQADYVFLLNNDAEIDPATSNEILREFEKDSNLAAIQPKIVLGSNPSIINNCGLEINYLGYAWDMGYQQPVDAWNTPREIQVFSGAAVILKKSAVDEVGGFDQTYFLYHEDVDLSLKLRNAGYSFQFLPTMLVTHHYAYQPAAWRYFYLERNRWFTIIKDYPWALIILMIPAAIFMEIGVFIFSLATGWAKEKMRSWVAVIKALPVLIRQRSSRPRRLATRDFIVGLRGNIVFGEVDFPLVKYVANPITNAYWLIIKALIMIFSNHQRVRS